MSSIEGLRSPYDKTVGGLHHLGRMIDKIRLKQAGKLPEDFHRNYGLGPGLDGLLCGMLSVKFEAVEARVQAGGTDAEIGEWVLANGLRPSRAQTYIWNEFSRKVGWNDRVSAYLQNAMKEGGFEQSGVVTSLDLIEVSEGRVPPGAAVGKG